MSSLHDAVVYVDTHGLSDAVVEHLGPDPSLYRAHTSDESLAALRDAGEFNELITRTLQIARHVAGKKCKDGFIKRHQFEDLEAFLIGKLVAIVKGGLKGVGKIRGYLYKSLFNATSDFVEFEKIFFLPENEAELIRGLERIQAGPQEPLNWEGVAALYIDFVACVRSPLQLQILERRFRIHEGRLSDYASDIAQDLGMTTKAVVAELRLLQKRYCKLVNQRRRSRNNKNYPALRQQPIGRVERIEQPPTTIEIVAAVAETRRKVRSTHPDQQPAVVPRPATPVVGGRGSCSTAA